MKKILGRILVIVSVLILGYQQFCYADVIIIEPIDKFRPIAFLIGFIGVIVLIITAISFFTLKLTIRNQNETGQSLESENNEKIEEKKNEIQRRFYIWGMILSIVGLIYLVLSDEISVIVFFIPIILFVISFIVRLKMKEINNNVEIQTDSYVVCNSNIVITSNN